MLNIDNYHMLVGLPIGAVVLNSKGQVFVRAHPAWWSATIPEPAAVSNQNLAELLPLTLVYPPVYGGRHLNGIGEAIADMFDIEVADPLALGATIATMLNGITANIESPLRPTWRDRFAKLLHGFRPPQPSEELQALAEARLVEAQLRDAEDVGDVATADQLQAELRDLLDDCDATDIVDS